MRFCRAVFVFGAVCLWLAAVLDLSRAQVPQSTDEIARTIGMCTIRAANLNEQLVQANAKIEALQKELDKLKPPEAKKK